MLTFFHLEDTPVGRTVRGARSAVQ